MATANVTVSLDPAVVEMAKVQARAAGLSMSAWVARTIRLATLAEAARRYEEFEAASDDTAQMQAWDQARGVDQWRRLAGAEW